MYYVQLHFVCKGMYTYVTTCMYTCTCTCVYSRALELKFWNWNDSGIFHF